MIVFMGLTVAFLAIILVYLVLWYRQQPNRRMGNFPSPPGYFFIGHAPYLDVPTKIIPFLSENLRKYDGFSRINIGTKSVLVVSNYKFLEWIMKSTKFITKSEDYQYVSNWLGNGLLLATGSHWKSHRKILTPAFHFQMMDNHIKSFQKVSDILIKKIKTNAVNKDSVDIYPIISAFTLDAVCESSMATSINAQENDRSDYVRAVRELCRILMDRSFDIIKMFDITFQFHSDYKLFNESVETVHKFDDAVIKQRKKYLEEIPENKNEKQNGHESVYDKNRNKNPFLDILLKSRDDNGEPLSKEEIREEVDIIMFAGYETTASAISFTLYNLAKNPEVQKLAYEEQIELFGSEKNPEVTYGKLCDMKYLEMVIKENLRLFPPVPYIGRKITEDCYYDGKLLPKGLSVTLGIINLHRNPEFWPEPEKFDPTRFEDETSRPAYAFVPFSAGPRNCIGQKFAMIEIKEAVSKILRNFEIYPASPAFEPKLIAEASLKSINGVCIKLKNRN